MKQRPTGIRLRQDVRGLLLSNFTSIFILVCGFALLASQTRMVSLSLVLAVVVGGFLFGPKTVVLGESMLDAGHRASPLRLAMERSDVQEAWYGHVAGFRGARVSGIQLLLADGSMVDLPMSEHLGEKRMELWVDQINAWVARSG